MAYCYKFTPSHENKFYVPFGYSGFPVQRYHMAE